MKYLMVLTTLFFLAACSQQGNNTQQLQAQIDSLQHKLDNTYKPGFGEFMSSIQVHHNKLWFAGTNNNWKLADFEINEIQEALNDIQQFNTDRPEARAIGMINPAIDSVNNAIKQQNKSLFKSSYTLLTNTCNNCHKATEHEFNVVTIPSHPPTSNQSFKPVQ
ncbi:MAG TPA: hypothetical protein VJA82_08020 [Sediminibacterium sp.]|uniref:hypothetical protein n=1 Tax=Sediminibacterium sp. TaxID=1917865 RepID=UPI002B4B5DF7|nr:hypothetical protein [Sediminibacterium sp.]HLD53234.1 hypothetical protein [Sediminibacterium sp.]